MQTILAMPSMLTLGASPIEHVIDHPAVKWDNIWWWSSHMTMLLVALAIVVFVGRWFAGQVQTGPESEGADRYITKNPFAHMLEVICVYLKEDIARPVLHARTEKMMPFLWTLFFFILTCNMLGMVPLLDLYHLINRRAAAEHTSIIGGTPTQNLYVTAALAIVAGFVINISGIRALGIKGYLEHLTVGAPWYVWPIIVPIELAGQILIKPIALAIRLFANMTAGHILLAQIIAFTGAGFGVGVALGGFVLIVATVGAVAIFFLEVFVAFLQAFIFFFLTTVFISLLDHHDEEHAHEESPVEAHTTEHGVAQGGGPPAPVTA